MGLQEPPHVSVARTCPLYVVMPTKLTASSPADGSPPPGEGRRGFAVGAATRGPRQDRSPLRATRSFASRQRSVVNTSDPCLLLTACALQLLIHSAGADWARCRSALPLTKHKWEMPQPLSCYMPVGRLYVSCRQLASGGACRMSRGPQLQALLGNSYLNSIERQ